MKTLIQLWGCMTSIHGVKEGRDFISSTATAEEGGWKLVSCLCAVSTF